MNASPFAGLPLFRHRRVVATLYPSFLPSELRAAMGFADLDLILLTDFMFCFLFRSHSSRSYLSLPSLGLPEQSFSIPLC